MRDLTCRDITGMAEETIVDDSVPDPKHPAPLAHASLALVASSL